jgi:hypothetical protein
MFEINCNRSFEKFLLNQNLLKTNRYKEDIAAHKTREVFLLSPDDLHDVLEIIRENSIQYQCFNIAEILERKRLSNERQKLALEKTKAKLENTKTKLEMLKLQNNVIDNEIAIENDTIEEDIIEEDVSEYIPKTKPEYVWVPGDTLFDVVKRNNSRSPYMQKYDPNTFEL